MTDLVRTTYELLAARIPKGRQALGRPLTDPVSLDKELPGLDPRLEPDSLSALTATALDNRAELAGLQSAAESIDSQAQSTRAKSRPQFAIIGGYTAMENNFLNREDFWSIGLGMQWDIFAKSNHSYLYCRSQ